MARKKRHPSWRGKTLGERVKLLEHENNALNRTVLDLAKRVTELENHPTGCSCTRCTG